MSSSAGRIVRASQSHAEQPSPLTAALEVDQRGVAGTARTGRAAALAGQGGRNAPGWCPKAWSRGVQGALRVGGVGVGGPSCR